MAELRLYAEAFSYPCPGRLEVYLAGLRDLPETPGRAEFAAFLQSLDRLTLGEWEELHTRTLDLNPEFAPYLGYQMWGDSYKRGSLMSQLNKAMRSAEIDLGGELPDHLMPVLRYLDQTNAPIPELVDILEQALEKMVRKLKQQDAGNPYLHLLRAVQADCTAN